MNGNNSNTMLSKGNRYRKTRSFAFSIPLFVLATFCVAELRKTWMMTGFTKGADSPNQQQQMSSRSTRAVVSSLWEAVAPVAFPMGDDGFIRLSDKVRTVMIDVCARESDYLQVLEDTKDPS